MSTAAFRAVDPAEVARLADALERAPAADIVRWAVDTFGSRVCLTASMTDAVLIDVATRVDPAIDVVFIDTGFHFSETLATAERVRRRYGLNLRIVPVVKPPVPFHVANPVECCSVAKAEALDRALEGKLAWMSGVRRAEAPTRAAAPVVALDHRGLVKVNPLATWTDDDVAAYVAAHDVPVNPLVDQGYLSIGCWPCTRPAATAAEPRSGRWDGVKMECGLHLEPQNIT
ncbi:MAG: phosphoadenylyl-sulfate reductase [Actinomycetota bacterium]|nr:phosphoadenylyl-sulfate reductase [Actinomycetota bacterium]